MFSDHADLFGVYQTIITFQFARLQLFNSSFHWKICLLTVRAAEDSATNGTFLSSYIFKFVKIPTKYQLPLPHYSLLNLSVAYLVLWPPRLLMLGWLVKEQCVRQRGVSTGGNMKRFSVYSVLGLNQTKARMSSVLWSEMSNQQTYQHGNCS